VDPANLPRKPYLFEQHFFSSDEADIGGLTLALEEQSFRIDTFAYDPDSVDRTWSVVAIKLDLLEERRVLAMSDEMEDLARRFDATYDGWLTRIG